MKGSTNRPLIVYTDGSCKSSGVGGWAAIIEDGRRICEYCGGELKTTSHRMELTAVIQALKAIGSPSRITVFTDSKYVADSVNRGSLAQWELNGWKNVDGKLLKNIDLWQELCKYLHIHKVEFQWVKAHSGNALNERCDKLAKEQSRARSDRR